MKLVTKLGNIPPKKGLTKVQQAIGNQGSTQFVSCPCEEVCKKLGTFKQGACFLGTTDTHKCLVANNLLQAKTAKLQ